MKSIIDFIPEEKIDRFNEIVEAAQAAKAAAPRKTGTHGPRTPEQKKAAALTRLAALEAKLAALEAGEVID